VESNECILALFSQGDDSLNTECLDIIKEEEQEDAEDMLMNNEKGDVDYSLMTERVVEEKDQGSIDLVLKVLAQMCDGQHRGLQVVMLLCLLDNVLDCRLLCCFVF